MTAGWKFLIGFVAGAAAGAATALLYAPSDGAELRRQAVSKAARGKDALTTRFAGAASGFTGRYATAKFQVERLFEAVTAGVQEARRVRLEIDDLIEKSGK